MTGGDGDDDYVVDTTADQVIETATGGNDTVSTTLANYTLGATIENLIVWSDQRPRHGQRARQHAVGRPGQQHPRRRRRQRQLNGMDGNDTLIGGLGADRLNGGAGSDRASYAGAAAAVCVDLATGTGLWGDAQGDTYAGIENVRGGTEPTCCSATRTPIRSRAARATTCCSGRTATTP